jgi:hypothetical protein
MREVPAVGIGVLGCGVISKAYLQALRSFPERALRAVADLRPDVAAARAASAGGPGHGDGPDGAGRADGGNRVASRHVACRPLHDPRASLA